MCSPATCPKCGRATYTGCGRHVEQVLGNVPASRRCSCGQQRTGAGQAPSTTAGATLGGATTAVREKSRRRWFRRG